MSIRTTADEKIDEATEHLTSAYEALKVVLDPDTWGTSHFDDDYLEELEHVALQILKMKRKL